jgi:hypothetical protein
MKKMKKNRHTFSERFWLIVVLNLIVLMIGILLSAIFSGMIYITPSLVVKCCIGTYIGTFILLSFYLILKKIKFITLIDNWLDKNDNYDNAHGGYA